jgi:hypothetical protein
MATFGGFKFNLLPAPSKEEVAKEENRDTSSIYIALFPLIATVLWLAVVVINATWVQGYIDGWNTKIASQNRQIDGFSLEKQSNGELFEKTKTLKPVITKHIIPNEFFSLVETRILTTSPETIIQNYGREESGRFTVTADAKDYQEVAKIIYDFTSDENFDEVKFQNVSMNSNGLVTFNLEFLFVGGGDTATQN